MRGILLVLPRRINPTTVDPFVPQKKLFHILKQIIWKMMEVDTAGALNDVIAQGKINDLILVQKPCRREKSRNCF